MNFQMKRVAVFVIVCFFLQGMITSCSEDNDPAENNLIGQWRITSVQVSSASLTQFSPESETIRIVFDENGEYSGNTTVNEFSGRYQIDGINTLTLLEFVTTEVSDTQFATAFYGAISEAILPDATFAQLGFSFDGGMLTLTFGNGGQMILENLQ